MNAHPDEMLADFQETYSLNVWGVCCGLQPDNPERMAALAWQLPRSARTWRAMDPSLANSTEAKLLRQIELNQRIWAWAHTKEAENGTNEPVPMPLPGEAERVEERERQATADAIEVAAAFSLNL